MASTRNLQATVNFALPFLNYQPLLIGGQEPALQAANMVLQTVLGPPFCWRWNRATAAIVCATNAQDYIVAAPTFGFIEKAWLTAPSGDIKEVQNKVALSASAEKARPSNICAIGDDSAGNITFRYNTIPDVAYAGTVLYQKKPRLLTSMADKWTPVPDEAAYIIEWGFLAIVAMLVGDGRFPIYGQKFMAHLLGAQDGLDEMQRNIFVGNWLELTKEAQRAQMRAQQGVAARQA